MLADERPIRIEDPEDPRIAGFRDIRERDLVGREGFVAEGTVVVEQLLASTRFAATSLLILDKRLRGVEAMLVKVPPATPIHVADSATFDRIAGFPVHRGVMALGKALPRSQEGECGFLAAVARAGGTVVVTVGIANHDNMGAIFRNAAAFGADLVLVDASSCDPLYRKAIRVSVGAVLTVPFQRVASGDAALGALQAAGFRCLALSPSGAEGVTAFAVAGPAALFLGGEGPGLAHSLMRQMQGVRIPMAPGFDSLNVATSAAIALHRIHAARSARDP